MAFCSRIVVGRFTAITACAYAFSSRIFGAGRKVLNKKETFLMGFITVPWTVKALGWKKKESEVQTDPNSTEAKLVNKLDSELLKDLKFADSIYGDHDGITHAEIHEKLLKHRGKNEPELLWRLARVIYELSKKAEKSDKMNLVTEAFQAVEKALALDEKNFAAHKWMAIILNELSGLKGTKEQITQSYNVKNHMERAAELNPKDATSIYLVGNWCFTVAEIPWYQKKIAETIFAKPPSCTYDEALTHFLRAENVQPLFYSMNLLMLAKSYMKVGNTEKAEEFLLLLKDLNMKTDEDYQARKEGSDILSQIQKSKKTTSQK